MAHWLDDSLRGDRIKQFINKLNKKEFTKDANKINLNNLIDHIEIQGYVHGLKAFKRSISDEIWNIMTSEDLFNNSVLKTIYLKIKTMSEENRQKWIKRFFNRMVREGLWGNGMKAKDISKLAK